MSGPPTKKKKSKFSVMPWTGEGEGTKILLYADSGMGKTTLASMAPNPVFIATDDGGRMIRNPKTGKELQVIQGIETFEDVRDALNTQSLFANYETVVIDQATELERWALPHLFKSRAKNQGGDTVKNVEDYGYHKGYRYWHDEMRLILGDCDKLVRTDKNIIIVCQSTIVKAVQAGAEDFVKEGPDLYHDKKISTLNAYVQWSDHVFRIATHDTRVKKGKATGDMTRAIYTQPEPHFYAKSRTLSSEYAVVSFDEPADDSIWRVLFDGNSN